MIIPRDANGHRSPAKAAPDNRFSGPGKGLQDVPTGVTLLTAALRQNSPDVVRILLSIPGIDPSVKDENGRTSLFYAGAKLNEDFLQILHHPGIDINDQDNDGNTALMYAALRHMYAVVEPLVSEGIDINIRNQLGVLSLFSRPLGTSPSPPAGSRVPRSQRIAMSISRASFRCSLILTDTPHRELPLPAHPQRWAFVLFFHAL
jgi:hypothetical protein